MGLNDTRVQQGKSLSGRPSYDVGSHFPPLSFRCLVLSGFSGLMAGLVALVKMIILSR